MYYLLSLKSHRRTSVLRTEYSGTGTEGIQTTPRVVPTVPPVILVGPHSDYLKLSSINGSVGGMDIPTKGVGSTLLNPHVGSNSGLDGRGGTVHHVTEHSRAGDRATGTMEWLESGNTAVQEFSDTECGTAPPILFTGEAVNRFARICSAQPQPHRITIHILLWRWMEGLVVRRTSAEKDILTKLTGEWRTGILLTDRNIIWSGTVPLGTTRLKMELTAVC
jgi:hypothetical protein